MPLSNQQWMTEIPRDDVDHMLSLGLNSNYDTVGADRVFYYERHLGEVPNLSRPILVLLHGYPQTNFMWRHIIPLLPNNIPLFIPDLYGYGRSMAIGHGGNKKVYESLLSRLSEFIEYADQNIPIILVGHDRGARLCHRIAVQASHKSTFMVQNRLNIVGTVLLDIVPTLTQFQSFASPANSVSTFHWPFLANVDLARDMISAYGGSKWAQMLISRWAGEDPTSLAKLQSNNAMEVYGRFFNSEYVVHATCEDYRSGADEDAKAQEKDMGYKVPKKIGIDALVIYSGGYLGGRYDVDKVWGEWMGKGKLECKGLGEGCGHFVAEERPEEVADAIVKFYERLEEQHPWDEPRRV